MGTNVNLFLNQLDAPSQISLYQAFVKYNNWDKMKRPRWIHGSQTSGKSRDGWMVGMWDPPVPLGYPVTSLVWKSKARALPFRVYRCYMVRVLWYHGPCRGDIEQMSPPTYLVWSGTFKNAHFLSGLVYYLSTSLAVSVPEVRSSGITQVISAPLVALNAGLRAVEALHTMIQRTRDHGPAHSAATNIV